jgi:aspartate kinase
MIVMKIGGSSLRSTDSLLRVVTLIEKEPDPEKCVVLSAVNGVTDHLIKSIDEALHTDRRISGVLDYLSSLHRELVTGAIQSPFHKRHVLDECEYLLSRLEKLLFGIAYTEECTRKTRDAVISIGERLAVQVVAGVLNDRGLSSVPMDSDKSGVTATGEFGFGNADLEATSVALPLAVNPVLQKGAIPVMTGFFGRTPDHHTITFGRGGTDYCAAVVAYAMDADELLIWKDVDGFMTADPEMVEHPLPLRDLGYSEAAELSYFGASILHPRTVEPLARKEIPARIKNTYHPEATGTVIGPEYQQREDVIKSVTFNPQIGALRLHGASLGQQVGFLSTVVSVLSENGFNIISVITSQTAVNLLLAKRDVSPCQQLVESLQIPYIDHVEPVLDVALVGVVGEGLAETRGLAARVFSSVANSGTNVEMIVSGASKVAQYFIIKEVDLKKTIQAIHREFFEQLS